MKIIDLLNMIAKGKAIPQKIKFREDIYYLDTGQEDYMRKRDNFGLLDQTCMFRYLNDTVEIIEEDEIQPEDVLSFTLTDKVWTPRQARELIENFRKISEKLKSKKDNNKIEKLKRITKCIGTDEEGTYYTDEYTIPELVVKIEEIIDKLNNME